MSEHLSSLNREKTIFEVLVPTALAGSFASADAVGDMAEAMQEVVVGYQINDANPAAA